MYKRLFYLLLMTCLFVVTAQAQELRVEDNATVRIKISAKEPTRISVDGDRIATLRGADGAYTYTNDNNQGAVYIKPTAAYENNPFYLFISTEQNHNYILVMTPMVSLAANMLVLKPKSIETAKADQWETSSPYTESLTKLVSDMATLSSPDGYDVVYVSKAKITNLGYQIKIRLKAIYSGAHLKGEIYEVTNSSLETVNLTERAFYQPGDRAISLRDYTLPAGGKTLLYKVISHG